MSEWIRFGIGAVLIVIGVYFSLMSVLGTFRFKYVLTRMHSAAMGDTLAILFVLAGLIVFSGLNFTSLKLAVIIVFFWLASPISSHLISNLVATVEHKKIMHDFPVIEAGDQNMNNSRMETKSNEKA